MFEQAKLTYGFGALEPYIDEVTMKTHYEKHHAAYTSKLNATLKEVPKHLDKSIEELLGNLSSIDDVGVRTAIRNNGGGYFNHNLYFTTLTPNGAPAPVGALGKQIITDFGSFANFQEKISAAAIGQFGSGWAWLSTDPQGNLRVSASANQDNPLMEEGNWTPILGIDVWEHAYYLKYKNLRPDYVKAFFSVIDWEEVARRYDKAKA